MARKARQRISYVLPLANSAGGHRLGVNGLAVDTNRSVLYSGGRDGVICAWNVNYSLGEAALPEHDAKPPTPPATTLRQKIQAHTHWINDIALVQSGQALASASSDITVKLWRPTAADGQPPQTLGLHSDYVKTLAVPSSHSDWIASGGLDRQIKLWDLSGAGQKLSIDVGEDEAGSMLSKEKASVYALAAAGTTLASGGPQQTAKVWDTRTGKRITKLVGHVDNVRDVLISRDGATIITASSDHTVKVWSTIAGRCMFTLTMHDEAVWSLFSADPDLSVFYSSDKNGLVARTDTRNTIELDEGLSVAVCQEHVGVHKVLAAGDSIWTGTSRPSINRWRDVNTDNAEIDLPENYNTHRSSIATQRSRYSPPAQRESMQSLTRSMSAAPKRKIPLKHVLRLSNFAYFPRLAQDNDGRRGTIDSIPTTSYTQPVRPSPDHIIEGQNGLKRGVMLNDRRRALTVDTAGEVVMWDLLKCVPIRSFGARDLDEVKDEVSTPATVANWCSIDTRTGSLAVVLEENSCFDGEMYADELEFDEDLEFRDDQRINLGKWVLRYLFDGLITEEIRRDEVFRSRLLHGNEPRRLQRDQAPPNIHIPPTQTNGWHNDSSAPPSASTIKPGANGTSAMPSTPGFNISFASPAFTSNLTTTNSLGNVLSPAGDDNVPLGSAEPQRESSDREYDYFSTSRLLATDATTPGSTAQQPMTPGGNTIPPQTPNPQPPATPSEADPQTPTPEGGAKEQQTPGKEGFFGKKLRMGMPTMNFSGMKKLGRAPTNDKPQPTEEKDSHESGSQTSQASSTGRVAEDNLLGTLQKMRFAYEDSLQRQLANQQAHEKGLPVAAVTSIELPSAITPSLPTETPVLKPHPDTTILIQEDRPEAGGVADLFEGTVGALGEVCDLVEKAAPTWLGDVLLRNQLPLKDVVKISFMLEPFEGSGLPAIASDGNSRLNANRMLRAKKILSYVAERIEPAPPPGQEHGMRPEEYLELWCQGQLVPTTMTLATIRSHLWRGGGDVLLYYRANGKKPIAWTGTSGYPPKPSTARDGQDAQPGAS